MIGNDVVDLGDPEAQVASLHPRFDERVFDEEERAAFAGSDTAWRRWAFWSAKEAAYKLARRRCPNTIFSPRGFSVRLVGFDPLDDPDESLRGRVCWDARARDAVADVEIHREGALVHAVAWDERCPEGDVIRAVAPLSEDEGRDPRGASFAARRLAIQTLATRMQIDSSELSVVRVGRLPELRRDGLCMPFDLSLSHHGRYVGFAAVPWAVDGGNA